MGYGNLKSECANMSGDYAAPMGDFALTFLDSATVAHLMHLSTKSYAQHVALGGYYEAIPGLVDGVIEAYQGRYDLVLRYTQSGGPDATSKSDPVKYLTGLQTYLDKQRKKLPPDANIQNEIDTVATLIDSTLYKLRFLS